MSALQRLAVVQAKAGDADAYRASIKRIKELAENSNKDEKAEWQNGETLGRIVYTLVRAGDLISARQTADEITDLERRNKALAEIGLVHAKAGELGAALATADAIHGSKTFNDTYNKAGVLVAVAVTRAREGDREESWRTLDLITDLPTKMGAYGALARAQATGGDFEGALATIDPIPKNSSRGLDARAEAMEALAEAQAKAGHLDTALATAERIADRRQKEKALIAIGKLQAAKGDLAAATAIADKIEKGDERDAVIVEILRAKVRAHDSTAALAAVADIGYSGRKTEALTAIGLTQAEEGDFDAAMSTLGQIDSDHAASAFCNLALIAYPKDPRAAQKALEKAKVGPSSSVDGRVDYSSYYDLLARTYARMRDWAEAEHYAEMSPSSDGQASAYKFIALQKAKAGDFPEAGRWSEKLKDPLARCAAFTDLSEELLWPVWPRK